MDIVEAVKVAKELATTGVVNDNGVGMPFYSKGKGGRYWFDVGQVTLESIEALLGYTVLVSQHPIEFSETIEIYIEETDKTDVYNYSGEIVIDALGNLVIPVMDQTIAQYTYDNRSNGYCDFENFEKDGLLKLGSELCVDELWAIYSLGKHKERD